MEIQIFEMSLSDLESIKNILSSDFDDFWSYNILKSELESPNSKYIIAKIENEIVGFAGVKIVFEEANIMNIVTKKIYRNNGIGKYLLENLIAFCKKLSVNTILLEVNENNFAALHLYENFGFKILSVRKNYYKNQSAIVMVKKI